MDRSYVYILRCADGSLYTGWTTDPGARLKAHNAGKGGKYTRSRLPVELVYVEKTADRIAAMRREWAIKRLTREQKLMLVGAGTGPDQRKGGVSPIAEKALQGALTDWLLDVDDDHALPEGITALHFVLFAGGDLAGEISVRQALCGMSYHIELTGAADGASAHREDFVPDKRECPGFSVPAEQPREDVLALTQRLLRNVLAELDGIGILDVARITLRFHDGEPVVLR